MVSCVIHWTSGIDSRALTLTKVVQLLQVPRVGDYVELGHDKDFWAIRIKHVIYVDGSTQVKLEGSGARS